MKAVCIKTYFDNELQRTVAAGEELDLHEERFAQLSTKNNDAKQALLKAKQEKALTEKPETEKNDKQSK